tara:strand:- start:5850 stop:6311 length:462 start_codon:yes stop_codon:yes gene_type:complete
MTTQKLKISSSEAFQRDLATGQDLENKILKSIQKKYPCAVLVPGKFKPYDIFVPGKDLKIEVKLDYKSQETGNILIELFMFGKPSALLTTEADYWIIHTGKEELWTTPRKIFECIILNNIRSQKILGKDDDKEKDACLIPINIFRKYVLDKSM